VVLSAFMKLRGFKCLFVLIMLSALCGGRGFMMLGGCKFSCIQSSWCSAASSMPIGFMRAGVYSFLQSSDHRRRLQSRDQSDVST